MVSPMSRQEAPSFKAGRFTIIILSNYEEKLLNETLRDYYDKTEDARSQVIDSENKTIRPAKTVWQEDVDKLRKRLKLKSFWEERECS